MSRRDASVLLVMVAALIAATAALVAAAALDAPWLAVVAVALLVIALVQRDRYLLRGTWPGVLLGVAVAVALGFVAERVL
jgi:hypothetical protein